MTELDIDNNFSTLATYANKLFTTLLDSSDIVSIYSCKKILKSNDFIYKNATKYLSESNAIKAIFISINLATVVYIYAYASYFLYLTTTFSGMKKLWEKAMIFAKIK